MKIKELVGVVLALAVSCLALGCNPWVQLPKEKVVCFSVEGETDKWEIDGAMRWFDDLGYAFFITSDVSQASIAIREVPGADWTAQTDRENGVIKVVPGLGTWTKHVIAHEIMHLLGVGHHVKPPNCNIMNENGLGCEPLNGFTYLDLQLYFAQSYNE